jgi:peptidoglycan/LPS O-acetylase OafA/YrhL
MSLSKDRIACLDGLRALSIFFVVLGHLAGTRHFPLHENMYSASLALLGVRVFFVISGFLITGLLLGELRDNGKVRLDRFYFRRTLRIFVPYYAFLTAIVVLDQLGIALVPAGDLVSAATYTTNYNGHAPWPIAHTWSLAVEEQFYLLWPAVLALLGRRRGLIAAALVIVAVPLVRTGQWDFFPSLRDGIGHRFETCADALATGCLLAGVRDPLHANRWYAALQRSPVALAVIGAAVVGTIVLDAHPRAAFALGWSLQNVGIAFVVDYCLRHADRGFGALMSTRPLVAVGRMSYSIYLWQQIFLDRTSTALQCSFPLNLVAVAVCATASYYGVELTSMAARQLLEPRLFRERRPVPATIPAGPRSVA